MACRCGFRRKLLDTRRGFDPDRTVYLDYNATTPVDPRVLGAFDRMCRKTWGNPSSLHRAGTAAWEEIHRCRATIGKAFGVDPEGILFCSGGTEGIHALLHGEAGRGRDVTFLTPSIEHAAVYHPLRLYRFYATKNNERIDGPGTRFVPVDFHGRIDLDALAREAARFGPAVFVYSPVNHETGGKQPVADIHRVMHAAGGRIIIDGVQAAARMWPPEWVPYCDAFAISGHKLYAPKGIGFIWRSPEPLPHPFRYGGGQEHGLFPGTENTPGIAALAEAARLITAEFREEEERLRVLTAEGEEILRSRAGVDIESPPERVAGVSCVGLPWACDMEKVMFMLHESRICVSRFSACSSGVTSPSRVLLAMGRSRRRAGRSLRISLGRWSRREDFFALAKALIGIRDGQRAYD